jgi:lysophospholipase L1-like esterase
MSIRDEYRVPGVYASKTEFKGISMATKSTPIDVYPRMARSMDREEHPPLSQYGWRLLAEGDSWFSISALNGKGSNLLNALKLFPSTTVVNCAYPGDTIVRVAQMVNDPDFDLLLRKPNHARFFEGILLSVGGNDVIDAAQIPPVINGAPVMPGRRLLLTSAEAAAINPGVAGALSRISEAGWSTFAGYIKAALNEIIKAKNQGLSSASPVLLHTYVEPVVRRAGVWPTSPDAWLFKAMSTYDIIAQADKQAIVSELFRRLKLLLLSFDQNSGLPSAIPNVHVFDASQVQLTPASSDSSGESGDWVNEIHPSKRGYRKFGTAMSPWIQNIIHQYPAGSAYLNPALP